MCPVIGVEVADETCGGEAVEGGKCCLEHTCEHPDCVEMAVCYVSGEEEGDMDHRWCDRHYVAEL